MAKHKEDCGRFAVWPKLRRWKLEGVVRSLNGIPFLKNPKPKTLNPKPKLRLSCFVFGGWSAAPVLGTFTSFSAPLIFPGPGIGCYTEAWRAGMLHGLSVLFPPSHLCGHCGELAEA